MCSYRPINRHLPTIRKIPDDLWDEIKLLLPPEKSDKTIGRPVIPFRKVRDPGVLQPQRGEARAFRRLSTSTSTHCCDLIRNSL